MSFLSVRKKPIPRLLIGAFGIIFIYPYWAKCNSTWLWVKTRGPVDRERTGLGPARSTEQVFFGTQAPGAMTH